ncbi:DNA-deoxyinosine glycosylase [Methyloversatilis sp.]|uniref:DNA-deoxyinosine glycosylase n=1 Tax=Methyloversatilis sp. TaxID=2569862 RepID=UPI00273325F8|nr:DNA-deoxyinosine glycosylase [Methyloversatilis sp.]MDP2870064.1 DNA-deoxyinosine glycosylase [Methyloversatilis sp.]MDP3287267.1 DNA-deoxyinosine glycosylase [Methyloversatilis sp.]MDP3454854.1 DNA-deoxyinosine glycosylase [Methyloversatilis sp.]MDP3576988.1 DNA-deoxyinosine glycosylase [Methyloversatilis sp.]
MPDGTRIRCFAPVADPATARVLILGSMPGAASLGANQYYAHPRNQFWSIMGTLVGAHPALPYAERLAVLTRAGLALWDVLASCERLGSLDSAIDLRSAQANDFVVFLQRHAGIQRVLFNGALAETCFRRDVMPYVRPLDMLRLPSTSPAHAGLSATDKLQVWRASLQPSQVVAV